MIPSLCNDTLIIDVGTEANVTITSHNQERYRYSSFISSTNKIWITFSSCFQYSMSPDNMFQLKAEIKGMDHEQVDCNGMDHEQVDCYDMDH